MTPVELKNVKKSYGEKEKQQVLFEVNLKIEENEFVAIVGQSGKR